MSVVSSKPIPSSGLAYTPSFWDEFGVSQPSLFLPLFGAGPGGRLLDVSKNNYSVTPNGTFSWQGGGINCDGSTFYATSNYAGVLGSGARTVYVIFNTTSTTTADNCLLSWGGSSGGAAGDIFSVTVENGVIFSRCDGGVTGSWGSGFNDGKDHIVALSYTAGSVFSSIRCFVDGKKLSGAFTGGTAVLNTASTWPVQLSRLTSLTTWPFLGVIKMVVILPIAHSDAQVATLNGNPWGMFQKPTKRRFFTLSGGNIYTETGSGGAIASGSVTLSRTIIAPASGGAVVGGSASLSITYTTVATSGAVTSGASVVEADYTCTASSGAITLGTVTTQVVYTASVAGGAVVGGQDLDTLTGLTFALSGTLTASPTLSGSLSSSTLAGDLSATPALTGTLSAN